MVQSPAATVLSELFSLSLSCSISLSLSLSLSPSKRCYSVFWHETVRQLPQTSNSLEGHFGHIRDIVRVHRGISDALLRKVLCAIFLASTIAPKKKKVA
jgi:hypothetical protein